MSPFLSILAQPDVAMQGPLGGHGYTITNNCAYIIYVRTKRGLDCLPGTTVIPRNGSAEWNYDNDTAECGYTVWVRIYSTNPGSRCASPADAGWSFTCTSCAPPPHG